MQATLAAALHQHSLLRTTSSIHIFWTILPEFGIHILDFRCHFAIHPLDAQHDLNQSSVRQHWAKIGEDGLWWIYLDNQIVISETSREIQSRRCWHQQMAKCVGVFATTTTTTTNDHQRPKWPRRTIKSQKCELSYQCHFHAFSILNLAGMWETGFS